MGAVRNQPYVVQPSTRRLATDGEHQHDDQAAVTRRL